MFEKYFPFSRICSGVGYRVFFFFFLQSVVWKTGMRSRQSSTGQEQGFHGRMQSTAVQFPDTLQEPLLTRRFRASGTDATLLALFCCMDKGLF